MVFRKNTKYYSRFFRFLVMSLLFVIICLTESGSKSRRLLMRTGILQEETAETISCVGQIGKDGMKETDREILKIMLEH